MPALPKAQSAGYLANHMARLFAVQLTEALRPLGIATAQFAVLLQLWQADGLTQRDLVVLLDLEQATVANTLARMERDGLIERCPHPEDQRAQIIHLTQPARALERPATAAARAVNHRALAGLAPGEVEQLLSLMARVIETQRLHRRQG